MAKKKDKGPEVKLERQYNVPLRKGWLKSPLYKRSKKAVFIKRDIFESIMD